MTPTITVYGKPACPQCTATVLWLRKRSIEHTYIDVTKDAAALEHVKALGYTSAPVIELSNGIDSWSGFQPGKLALLEGGW